MDYGEVCAPVARIETVCLVVSVENQEGWSMHQLDFKSAFLNYFLREEVYVLQPRGFEVKEQVHMVYKINKALYGLKQDPRAWNRRIDEFLC